MATQFDRTIAFRNRNPLNIRYVNTIKWQGQIGNNGGGFVTFGAFSYGYRAALRILRNYRLRGIKTISQIISTWAPRSENNTVAYIKTVVDYMNGIFRTQDRLDHLKGVLNQFYEFTPESVIDLRDREEVKNLLMAMTKIEMGANAAQLHYMRQFIYIGYDLAVTDKNFFKGI